MDNMENVKKIEMDILNEVIRICDKYNIEYFAGYGTLLGAVRHKGFIPWDDDIDLAMNRKDYNRFIKVAKKELKEPYFLQCNYTDKTYIGELIHIRRSDTTAILKKHGLTKKFNQGIFIDIFPQDGVIENPKIRNLQTKVILFLKHLLKIKYYYDKNSEKRLSKVLFTIFIRPFILLIPHSFIFRMEEAVAGWGNSKKTKYIDEVFYRIPLGLHNEIRKIKKEWLDSSILMDFENIKIKVPAHYDEVLRETYGDDYMTPKQVSTDHGSVFFDVNNSYKLYLNGELKFEE